MNALTMVLAISFGLMLLCIVLGAWWAVRARRMHWEEFQARQGRGRGTRNK